MAPKAVAASLALAFAVAACTGEPPGGLGDEVVTFPPEPAPAAPETTQPAPVTTAPPATSGTQPPAPLEAPGGPAPGRLVTIDGSGNVVVIRPDGSEALALTDAAGNAAAYFQPSWSPDGTRVAWGEASAAGFALATAMPDATDRASIPMPSPPFFFLWSPDGRHLAVLHNATNGIEMKLVSPESGGSVLGGSGVPFYLSWSPTSEEVAAHIGADRLVAIGLNGTRRDIGPTADGYQAPHWLNDGIVHYDGEELVLSTAESVTRPLAGVAAPLMFVADPHGRRLAVQAFGEGQPALSVALQAVPDLSANRVVVFDLGSGAVRTAADGLAVGFFWSPDGERLLILRPADEEGHLEALVWSGDGTRPVATFAPPSSFIRDVLPFFSQYAQSLQPWAPDSASFAFAGRIDGREGIWVVPIGGEPLLVGAGTWVAWSPR
jgi:hypothetical protein